MYVCSCFSAVKHADNNSKPAPRFHALWQARGGPSHARKRGGAVLDRQLLAATVAAAGQHFTAILGAHAGTETMHLVALAFLGLIGTFHDDNNSF